MQKRHATNLSPVHTQEAARMDKAKTPERCQTQNETYPAAEKEVSLEIKYVMHRTTFSE